jgi:hypothetical protein
MAVTDGFLDWRLTQTRYTGCPIGRAGSGNRGTAYVFVSVLSVQSVANFILAQGSRLLFLAEFLENGIAAQRIPDRIESKKGWRNGRSAGTRGIGRV